MKKSLVSLISSFLILFTLSGCSAGSKTDSLLGIYIATAIISLMILVAYFCVIKKRNLWFVLLLASVFIVNTGYLSLAISSTLEEALLANRISYLGSVFLPMSMLMIIINDIKIKYKKILPFILLGVGIVIFLIAATPGYLDMYYKEVSLASVNGVSVLNKVYGSWHIAYLIYLFVYFGAMISVVIISAVKKTVNSSVHSVILALAVGINIGIWLLEQFIRVDIELLSISYIITEIFLLGLNFIFQEEKQNPTDSPNPQIITYKEKTELSEEDAKPDDEDSEETKLFLDGIASLTATEHNIFKLYLDGKGTKDVLAEMNIKENTLKYHNKNIYSKLGVSSRKQLLALALKSDIKK